jgi:hypothetical protein
MQIPGHPLGGQGGLHGAFFGVLGKLQYSLSITTTSDFFVVMRTLLSWALAAVPKLTTEIM